MIWWQSNPTFFESFQLELADHPSLRLTQEGKSIVLIGDWPVYGDQKYIRSYSIRIEVPDNFPIEVPLVFETAGQIPKTPQRHFNHQDDSACLFSRPERWEKWPPGSSIGRFLDGAVREFFFSQAYFELEEKWPFGDWSHGDLGVFEYFLDRLKLHSIVHLQALLRLKRFGKPWRQWKCPCDPSRRYRACHFPLLEKLLAILPEEEWLYLEKALADANNLTRK